jgi:flagellar biosynthesis/type III secretory pathway M-ring protein FliF/YscJ
MVSRNFLNEVRVFQFKKLTYDPNINTKEGMEKINLENNNKKISIIPLLILLIFALLAGICYKKFIKKNKKES